MQGSKGTEGKPGRAPVANRAKAKGNGTGSERLLRIKGTIKRWDEAIPLGNGLIGSLLWGRAGKYIVSLDRGDIWDVRPIPATLDPDFRYQKLIELVKAGDHQGILSKFEDGYFGTYPSKLPAGRLELCFDGFRVQESLLNLETATAEIRLRHPDGKASIQGFLHAQERYGWLRIVSEQGFPSVCIKAPDFGVEGERSTSASGRKPWRDSLKNLVYPRRMEGSNGELQYFVQQKTDASSYGVFVLQVRTGNTLDVLYYVGNSNDGEGWVERAEHLLRNAACLGFEHALATHTDWWKQFWSKSAVSLPDPLFENQWYLTNYLLASCSRKGCPPMPLQGLWTADDGKLPPWKGDYHHDLNTQLCYMHYAKANHMEEGESFVDFLWALVPAARAFARSFFDAEGLCLPSVMTIDGKPLCGWSMYSINLTNQIWLCQVFDLHYRYAGDAAFLRDKVYSYFKETALCVLRWLFPDRHGKLKLALSASPEIHDNTLAAWLTPNSNFDQALLIYLFETLAKYAKVLQNGEESRWLAHLAQLEPVWNDEAAGLKISQDEILTESHRHLSHAMAIHPLKQMDYRTPDGKKTIDATIKHLEKLGTQRWTGYTFAWFAHLYVVAGSGEGAYAQLKAFWENFVSPNGFHLNGDFRKRGFSLYEDRPFTLEGNMCAASALQDMLLTSDAAGIEVFPAIPAQWKQQEVSFSNFRAFDGLLVSAKCADGQLRCISLAPTKDTQVNILNSFAQCEIALHAGQEIRSIACNIGDRFALELKANEQYTLHCGDRVK